MKKSIFILILAFMAISCESRRPLPVAEKLEQDTLLKGSFYQLQSIMGTSPTFIYSDTASEDYMCSRSAVEYDQLTISLHECYYAYDSSYVNYMEVSGDKKQLAQFNKRLVKWGISLHPKNDSTFTIYSDVNDEFPVVFIHDF